MPRVAFTALGKVALVSLLAVLQPDGDLLRKVLPEETLGYAWRCVMSGPKFRDL